MNQVLDELSCAVEEGDVVRMRRNALRVEGNKDVDCGSRLIGGFLGHRFREVRREC